MSASVNSLRSSDHKDQLQAAASAKWRAWESIPFLCGAAQKIGQTLMKSSHISFGLLLELFTDDRRKQPAMKSDDVKSPVCTRYGQNDHPLR
jgi:hypothetical protein